MRLGRNKSPEGAVKLKFSDYVDTNIILPKIPQTFGHYNQVASWQGMLGNDLYGDCVWAGAAHEHIVFNSANKRSVAFTDSDVLSDYSAVTGFNAADPNSDQGTDMAAAAEYRLKTGILGSDGTRHKVGAYLALAPGDIYELVAATYLFGAVGIGINITEAAMQQFKDGKAWTYKRGSKDLGGHYVPVVGRKGVTFFTVSWGRLQAMSWAFFVKQSDETIAYVSTDYLTADKSPEGFNQAALLADLQAVRHLK